MLRTQLAALALAAIWLAASGCGGSSKTGSATIAALATSPTTAAASVKVAAGKPLTQAQLVTAADAICASTNQKLSTLSVVDKKEFARLIPQVAVYDATESEELSKLVPPAAMKHDWEQILKDFYRYSEYTTQVARYDQTSNFKASVPLIQSAESLHQELVILARRDGFRHCSRLS